MIDPNKYSLLNTSTFSIPEEDISGEKHVVWEECVIQGTR